MGTQLVIKVLLIAIFVGLVAVLVVQRPGARPLAIRRLTYLALLIAAITAVIFPNWLTWIAELVGVGRGTDLLLYGTVVVFISHSLASKSQHVGADQRTTLLAREIAIMQAEPADVAGRRLSTNADDAAPAED